MSKEELVECEGEEHLRIRHVRSAGGFLVRKAGGKQELLKRIVSAELLLLAA